MVICQQISQNGNYFNRTSTHFVGLPTTFFQPETMAICANGYVVSVITVEQTNYSATQLHREQRLFCEVFGMEIIIIHLHESYLRRGPILLLVLNILKVVPNPMVGLPQESNYDYWAGYP